MSIISDNPNIDEMRIEDTEEVHEILEGMGFSASLVDYKYWHFHKVFGNRSHIVHVFMSSPVVIRVNDIVLNVKTIGELKTWLRLTFVEVTNE